MNMMRKNNNRGGNNKHRGGQRRYNNNGGGGGNRGQNDGQNLQRTKHHATQQLGKYNDLARNAQINGDRVDVEYYLQHVDHYTRVLTDIAAIEAERYAHVRESQPQAVSAEGGENASGDASSGDQGSAENAGSNAAEDQDGQRQHHQRRDRGPRRPYQDQQQAQPGEASDNGAKEANSNTTDIPLPGSILPPI